MRAVYFLIILFLLACIIGAEVYIYQVKSASFFQATGISSGLWLVELLLMLTVACLIGFGIAWQLREETISKHLSEIQLHEDEKQILTERTTAAQQEIEQAQQKLSRAQESFKEDFKAWSREKDKLKEDLTAQQTISDAAKGELTHLQKKIDQQEKELMLGLDNNLLLKANLEKAQAEIENLKSKATKSFTLPAKDDLKLIAGVGPAIEKKLNGLGIYSFRQISEFTPRTIEEISQAIKFFPGRIERDNWVSQARNLEAERKRQEG
jgi:predicted flap endonuclease-1-like 5' DNA nuclease